jgi:hypothetical protein
MVERVMCASGAVNARAVPTWVPTSSRTSITFGLHVGQAEVVMYEPRHLGDAKDLPLFISRAPTEAAGIEPGQQACGALRPELAAAVLGSEGHAPRSSRKCSRSISPSSRSGLRLAQGQTRRPTPERVTAPQPCRG